MLKYLVREFATVEYDMGVEQFKDYIVELRGFYDNEPKPKFYQLMRRADHEGYITECASLPCNLVGDVVPSDLDGWFDWNYKSVYTYLKDNKIVLY